MNSWFDPRRTTIAGRSTGGKDDSGSGSGGGTEEPNSLKSRQTAKIMDLLSEGPIKGIVGGWKGIFLDGTPLQNSDGTLNFTNTTVQAMNGWPDQLIAKGATQTEAEEAVAVRLMHGISVTRTIINTDADRVRITVSVPSLQYIDTETGDITGSSVEFAIALQNAGGGWQEVGHFVIDGKTNSNYQYAVMFLLPRGGPWDIALTRITADSDVIELQDELYWDSFTEIIDDRLNYTLSAYTAIQTDAEQFGSVPKRTYLVDGLLVQIPTNYNPYTGILTGVWDGSFKYDWTCNPAWCLYDLICNNRYGIGDFITADMIDKWSFYGVAWWCDMLIPDGKGGWQRRFTCNVQITSQAEAFDLLTQFASIFRGFIYWSGSQLIAVADNPKPAVYQYTNANVIDGQFTYTGTDLRSRHSMAAISWNDPDQFGEQRISVVEDRAGISRYGIQKVDVSRLGCTNEGEALRAGKWQLYTEQYEGEMISFTTGHEGAWARPGDIIQVMDALVAGKRRGGRVVDATTMSVWFDAPIFSFVPGYEGYISCVVGEGAVETRQVIALAPDNSSVNIIAPFSAAPAPDTIFVISQLLNLEPTLWRVMTMRQTAPDQYEVTAMRHLPGKWDYVEQNLALTIPDVSDISTLPGAVTDLTIGEYLVATSPISVGVRATISWNSGAPSFDVVYRNKSANGNWYGLRTDSHAVDVAVTEGVWTFQVTPISLIGLKGIPVSTDKQIIGRFAPPATPRNFKVTKNDGMALFSWTPATELDVVIGGHYELRHSTQTSGARWENSNIVISTIPGTASTVEADYRVGTWMLRVFDIVGIASASWATIISTAPDTRFTEFARICENPTFLGTRLGTEVMLPQEWLVLGTTGGLWDAQTSNMDTWSDVDVLPMVGPPPPQSIGYYYFNNRIDAGGLFTIRLSADMLAFPFAEPDEFFDSRMTDCDTWSNFDDVSSDYGGTVTILMRETLQAPSATADWTAWHVFQAGEYSARAYEFMAVLQAPVGQNIGIEELCIIADLRMKMDSDEDVPYPAADTTIFFSVKFYTVPAVVLTVQNALNTDDIQVIAKDREKFTVRIRNGGVQQTRTFDWQARGFQYILAAGLGGLLSCLNMFSTAPWMVT